MTVPTFRELFAQRPLKPFRPVMSSSQTYGVGYPEMEMRTKSDLPIRVGNTEECVPAKFKICSLLHVSAFETVGASANGST